MESETPHIVTYHRHILGSALIYHQVHIGRLAFDCCTSLYDLFNDVEVALRISHRIGCVRRMKENVPARIDFDFEEISGRRRRVIDGENFFIVR